VAPLIYESDPNKLSTTLATRVRANPPPAATNEELGQSILGLSEVDNDTAKRLRDILV
jgi:hypothetical protein